MAQLGKLLIVIGVICIVAGALVILAPKLPHFGRLPGDIYIKKERFTFYFPITTSIIVSVILSILFWIFRNK